MKQLKLILLGLLFCFSAVAQDKKTSEETTGGTLKNADLFRYSEESSGTYSSKKHTMATLKEYVLDGFERVYNEVPSIDVTRTILTLDFDFVSGTQCLFIGGVRVAPTTDFTETDTDQVTMTTPIPVGTVVIIDYNKQ